jgi:hypothetical protein
MGLDIRHVVPCLRTPELEPLDYFTVDEVIKNEQFFNRYKNLLIKIDGEDNPVIFFKELGYQRSGMNKEFYQVFENDKLYFTRKEVLKAYEYLEGNSNYSINELQNNFQLNFIERFVEGESIFFASW